MNAAVRIFASRPLPSAALAGMLAVGAFEPLDQPLLGLLAPAALLLLWQAAGPSPRRAALIGFFFGLGFFGAGVSWVYVSLHTFGMMPAPLAALATVLFCAFLALFPAAVGYAQAAMRAGRAASLLLAAPALWALLEWLRGWIFTGFPWISLGYSQTGTLLAGYAPLLGVFGVTLVLMVCSGLLALALSAPGRQKLAAAAALAAVLALGAGLRELAWTQASGQPVGVALAQGNVPQSMKFEPGRYETTLAAYRRLIEQGARGGARLVVLPETAIPRFLDQVSPRYLEDLQALMRERRADLLLGAPMRDRDGYYNAVASLGLSQPQTYSKTHLVPFGEFIPAGFGWILEVLHIPLSDFSRGAAAQRPLALAGRPDLKVAVNICYEDAFGGEIARQLPEATLLANVSNVAWFGDSLAPDQHLQISQMRAIETGRYMLRATNSGVTAIIDERGRVAARLPKFTEGLLQGSAQPFTGSTPFVRWGDWAAVALCVLMLAAAALASARRANNGASNRL